MPASYAWIGLAAPGEAGSWQTETKVSVEGVIRLICLVTLSS